MSGIHGFHRFVMMLSKLLDKLLAVFNNVWLGCLGFIVASVLVVMVYQWVTRPYTRERYPPNFHCEVDGVTIYYYDPDEDSDNEAAPHPHEE